MEASVSLVFAALIGFGHAFEADHLLAVSTLVSKSNSSKQVVSNGFWWGLGHTSTILFIGILLILFQLNSLKNYFAYFEIFVGLMLVILGIVRLFQYYSKQESSPTHTHDKEAYGIGLIHGLAGSGTLVLLVLADLNSDWEAICYLLLFGLGSAVGMSVAASLLRLPVLSCKGTQQRRLIFTWLSSLLCLGYGISIFLRFL